MFEQSEETKGKLEQGDTFDEDSGDFLGLLEIPPVLPVNISVCIHGQMYVYKLDKRYIPEEEEAQPTIEPKTDFEDL